MDKAGTPATQALAGKIALVTGGSRGIGAAIVERLAREGADVALTYVSAEQKAQATVGLVESLGRKALAIRADSADPQAVAGAVQRTIASFGRIDILVNNAGIFHAGPLQELSVEDFDRTMAVNVRAAFVAAKEAAAAMPAGGRIINIGSNLAVRAFGPGLTLYTASKAAIAGLTQALARDLGPRGITANVVHPGSTDTDMNPADGPGAAHQTSLMASAGGYAAPADVAAVVAFLASPAAQSVNGAAWTVDNGTNA
jgi:NAD(P)-dependent dehydrogenase (short-subunit alcohol dehydrogenase family)